MNVTDWKFPTVAANYNDGGNSEWVNVNNVKFADGAIAQSGYQIKNETTQQLRGYSFDFSSIPAGATINGIEAIINRKLFKDAGYITDSIFQLIYNGNLIGSNYASAMHWPTSYTDATYGGASDLWGYALTRAIVQSSTFGLVLKVVDVANGGNGETPAVDYFKMRVYYTAGGGDKIISMGFIGDNPKISNIKVLKDTGWEQHAVKINKTTGWT